LYSPALKIRYVVQDTKGKAFFNSLRRKGTGAGMWKCLEGSLDLEILVHQGQLYLPLLFDPEVHVECQALASQGALRELFPADSPHSSFPPILGVQGRLFARAVSATSLVDNYARLFPQESEDRRHLLREQYSLAADLWGVALDSKLITIIFHILPHFVRRAGLSRRRPLAEAEILDFIRERLPVPARFAEEARRFLDLNPVKEAVRRLETVTWELKAPPEGLVPAAVLQAWWEESLTTRLLHEERARLIKELEERQYWAGGQEQRLAVLLYLAERGSLELDGFGFARLPSGRDYRIYKHTGPYVLKDYFGRPYLFPDCRVAVATLGRLRPVVVDHYKHPFLRQHGPGQEICLGSENQYLTFSAKHVIQAIEDGINALCYSYDSRRRLGYHRLDALPGMMHLVDFEDYRIPADHPLAVPGDMEVKKPTT
jgi:hypothetical protein